MHNPARTRSWTNGRWARLLIVGLLFVGTAAGARAQGDTIRVRRPLVAIGDPVAYDSLEARLQAIYSEIEAFDDVRVRVRNGVVHLEGAVPRAEARERAEVIAYRFADVLYVVNDLTPETGVEERVSPAFERLRDWLRRVLDYLPVLGVAMGILVLALLLARFVQGWNAPFRRLGIDPLLRNLIQQVLGFILFVLGLVLALEVLDITALVGAILGAAGVVGLALGFAFQDIIQNYLAGALLSIRRPFELNDYISVDRYEGRVLRLTARELILMTLDGNHVRIPNATVFKSIICNFTRNPRRRFDIEVGIGTNEDLVRVQEVGRRALQAMRGVMHDPGPFAFVESLGDWNVTVRFFGWVDQREADYFKVRSEAVRLVKAALDEAGVAMPVPIHAVRLREADREAAEPATLPQDRSVEDEAREVDVSPDVQLDAQVREELERPGDENLLV